MNLLLDSNVFIYVIQQPEQLLPSARDAIIDPRNTRYLSVATPWELQIKASLGKFEFTKPVCDIVQQEVDTGTVVLLPISIEHIDVLSRLPHLHRDPFDRLLIAQAIHENLTLIKSDKHLTMYPVSVL